MRIHSIKYIILIAGLAGVLYSCSTPRHFQRETVNTDGLYGSEAKTDSATIADTPWSKLFTETYLQQLIQEGLDNNPDLQIAVLKVLEAEAYFSQSKAAMLPGISAKGTGTYTRNPESIYPDGPREVSTFQLGAEASWEIDLWGKLRSSKRGAYANLLGTDAGKKAVQTWLIANIATAYYSLVALDAKLAITQETVKNNIDLVETMKVLKESGRVTGAAIVQSEAARYAAEVTIPDLEQQIRETENTLCQLLGRVPGTIARGKIDEQNLSSVLQTGVPAQLLDNRPDVMQAEFAVMSAFETTNNARAYFYPALTLTASTGFAAADLDKLLDPKSFAANIIGGLTQPLFNKRINSTRLKVAQAQQEESLINFRNTLLIAGQEVHNALGSYESSVKKIALRQLQLEALIKSVDYTKELLNYGSATYTEVLNAQTSLLSAQLSSVNDHIQQLNATVSLYRALGGGWK
ncbi:MAG TPA: TolC family protein [Prolixibacteraceae bacterium]|nr:TolC family protein [Prolixibacteraceae bacterium]